VLQPERAQDLVDHRGVGNLGLVLGLGTRHGVGGRLLAGEHRALTRHPAVGAVKRVECRR
jgi:hypothetical protein